MFNNVRREDRVWHFAKGWGIVVSVNKHTSYPIIVEFKGKVRIAFLLDGKEHINDINPSLYWNELQLQNDEDEDIMNFLKERLEPLGIYDFSEYYFITYIHTTKTWSHGSGFGAKEIGLLSFKKCPDSQIIDVCRELELRKISYNKFIEICKNLGWI